MVTKEAILEDPALDDFFGSLYLYRDLRESINVRLQALIFPMHNVIQGRYSNMLPSMGGEMGSQEVADLCPWFNATMREVVKP